MARSAAEAETTALVDGLSCGRLVIAGIMRDLVGQSVPPLCYTGKDSCRSNVQSGGNNGQPKYLPKHSGVNLGFARDVLHM